jgi:prepilin-type N-terminal cleavage/methylation domain-containing protein
MHTSLRSRSIGRLRSTAGVTLMEIMIVVAIIGLLSAMAFPRFANWTSALRAKGAASQVAADIAYTRMTAVREGRTAVLTVNGNNYTMTVENPDGTVFKTLRTVRVQDSYPGTTIGTTGGTRIAFDSRGMRKDGSGSTLTLTRNDRSQTLQVTIIGRVVRDAPH